LLVLKSPFVKGGLSKEFRYLPPLWKRGVRHNG
jgi:hypothetical protein